MIIGFIGDRGGGKSIGGSQVVTRDYLVRGEPCFSNIEIRPSFKIDDQLSSEWIGSEYGLADGGVANYSSQPLDIYKFLQFSDEYSGGVIYIDEINIALADARRSMSYQNLGSADVGQQLRKLKTALIYTCIQEQYVDVRIRDLTDFVIKTKDAAYVNDGIPHKREGELFHWEVYPMTDKAAAILGTFQKYTGKKGGPGPIKLTVPGHSWWGTLDTWQHQDRRKYKKGEFTANSPAEAITENPQIIQAKQEWGWLEKVANRIIDRAADNDGMVLCGVVMNWPEVIEHKLSQTKVSAELNRRFNIWPKTAHIKDGGGRKAQHYIVADALVVV